jgi:hypothetical protein
MIRVYTGLTLGRSAVQRILPNANFAFPIKRGDLRGAIDDGIHTVVIIDGKFHQDLAVTPDEIMDAMRCGVKIYGASSMGALRASELYPFGMVGHGLVFKHIKCSGDFRDDFVAQVFEEVDENIRIISYSYIDFFMNIIALENKGLITVWERAILLKLYASIFYAERSWPALRVKLCKCYHNERLLSIAKQACLQMGSQKYRDAVSVLRRVRIDINRVKNCLMHN